MTHHTRRTGLRALVPSLALAVAVSGCGTGDSGADRAGTTVSATLPTTASAPSTDTSTSRSDRMRARTGDDGLTYTQARRAERHAKRAVAGVVIEIDRDNNDHGSVSYDVDVLNRAGKRTQVTFDGRFRVTRKKTKSVPEHLTYEQARRARKAALDRTSGVVTDVDGEDEGRVRFEVDVLTSKAGSKTIQLSRSYDVVPTNSAGGDD